METIIKVGPDEFTYSLVDKIKLFLRDRKNFEIIINVKEKIEQEFLFEESAEEYVTRLNKSIQDIEKNRELISLSVEEFERLANSLGKK